MSRQLDHGRETLMDIFHRHRQAGEHDIAMTVLDRAMHTEYGPEAQLWKGIVALSQDPGRAFLFFASAARALPNRPDVHALVGRSLLAQHEEILATRYLTEAWKKQPYDPGLRMLLWHARNQSESAVEMRRMILAHLSDVQTGPELALLIKLLNQQQDQPAVVGVACYFPEQREIRGWALHLDNLQMPATLMVEIPGKRVKVPANQKHPLLVTAGLTSTHGGFRIKVPETVTIVNILTATGEPLQGSPIHAIPPFIPPIPVKKDDRQTVDVLIPVYDGLEETLECINSALDCRKYNQTPYRLVVIDDCTPIPALAKSLKILAAKGKIILLRNTVNLGFIRSMNRAMAHGLTHDVVWLNADTRVHGTWLDRLRHVAYSNESIASVTPFTNNGELMSFPESQVSHPMPSIKAHAELDELARQTEHPPVEIETGCGFCLYIKRAALDEVGYLDDVHLARGYGEETDWCLRAREAGWTHVGAPNIFVAHKGGVSFGPEKVLRVAQNNAVLRERYPAASKSYNAFLLRDPIKEARQALQLARLVKAHEMADKGASGKAQLLTLYLEEHCTLGLEKRRRQLSLSWQYRSHGALVTLEYDHQPLPIRLSFDLPEQEESLKAALCLLPIQAMVYRQVERCPQELLELPLELKVEYEVSCDIEKLYDSENANALRCAQGATRVRVPWQALVETYTLSFGSTKLVMDAPVPNCVEPSNSVKTLVIGDKLHNTVIARRWLEAAQHIAKSGSPLLLLTLEDTPWTAALHKMGVAMPLPRLAELSLSERARAGGCEGVLSLDDNPDSSWTAPSIALELDVALYALPSRVSEEAGAAPWSLSMFTMSQI